MPHHLPASPGRASSTSDPANRKGDNPAATQPVGRGFARRTHSEACLKEVCLSSSFQAPARFDELTTGAFSKFPGSLVWSSPLIPSPRVLSAGESVTRGFHVRLLAGLCALFALPFASLTAAEVIEIGPDQTSLLPGGKEADGIIGDFVLRNDRVEAVIAGNQPLRRANMSTYYGAGGITPGCLYDLTLRGRNNDQLTIFGPAGRRGPVSYVRALPDLEGGAAVETVITAAQNNGIEERHVYRLQDGWQGVVIESHFANLRDSEAGIDIEDQWTRFNEEGKFGSIRWADSVDPADHAGYAFASVPRESDGAAPVARLTLRPGERRVVTRFLSVGTSPADALSQVAVFRGPTGRIEGTVTDHSGRPVATAALRIQRDGQAIKAYVSDAGTFSIALPPGDYDVAVLDPGRNSEPKALSVAAGETVRYQPTLGPASGIDIEITDVNGRPLPCKVQFLGINGTISPDLGPPNRAHGCRDQYHSENGAFRVQLAPGDYRVVVTRGIEFSHLIREVKVSAGAFANVRGRLTRLLDTTGWISADFHNHSTPSGDNTCGTADRIINLAAEHIEFAPTTEHNRLFDWQPTIEQLGLTNELATVPGMELTGSGAHFNAFPFRPAPFTQDRGAPVWNSDPRITALLLRHHQFEEPDRWIQINHPDLIQNFIDRDGDGTADGGFISLGRLIDGVETQNFSPSKILDPAPMEIIRDRTGREILIYNREFIWLQLLNQGQRIVGMAVADAHSVHGNGVGGWRMYFPSRRDEPWRIDWREISRHAKAGRSVLTTGPFLKVDIDGRFGPGDDVRWSGTVPLRIHVQCTDWIDIDRVQILVNGRALKSLNFTRATHPEWFGGGIVKFDRTIEVPLQEDAHLIVVACAEGQDLSLGYGTSDQRDLKPVAYNNPIYVDVDGGGFQAGGDTLDWALMTKRYQLEDARAVLRSGADTAAR